MYFILKCFKIITKYFLNAAFFMFLDNFLNWSKGVKKIIGLAPVFKTVFKLSWHLKKSDFESSVQLGTPALAALNTCCLGRKEISEEHCGVHHEKSENENVV